MLTTTYHDLHATMTRGHAADSADADAELLARYQRLVKTKYFPWTVHSHFRRRLGSGGQGIVFLTEHRGADGFTVPVAVKVLRPSAMTTPGGTTRPWCGLPMFRRSSLASSRTIC